MALNRTRILQVCGLHFFLTKGRHTYLIAHFFSARVFLPLAISDIRRLLVGQAPVELHWSLILTSTDVHSIIRSLVDHVCRLHVDSDLIRFEVPLLRCFCLELAPHKLPSVTLRTQVEKFECFVNFDDALITAPIFGSLQPKLLLADITNFPGSRTYLPIQKLLLYFFPIFQLVTAWTLLTQVNDTAFKVLLRHGGIKLPSILKNHLDCKELICVQRVLNYLVNA